MQKDFDAWNENKKRLHVEGENKLYHKQEVWWCSLGVNVGFEQDGTGIDGQRPVLILKSMGRLLHRSFDDIKKDTSHARTDWID